MDWLERRISSYLAAALNLWPPFLTLRLQVVGYLLGASVRALQHRPEIAPREDMEVEMRHLLVGMLAVVGEHPIARLHEAELAGDLADAPHEPREFGVARLLGEVVHGDVG